MHFNQTSKMTRPQPEFARLVPLVFVVTLLLGSLDVAAIQRQQKSNNAQGTQAVNQVRKSEIAALLQAGQMEQAQAAARNALVSEPRDGELHDLLGVALERSGQFDQAELEYRKAIELDAHLVSARGNLGVMLARTHRDAESINAFQDALRLVTGHLQARVNLALLYGSKRELSRAMP